MSETPNEWVTESVWPADPESLQTIRRCVTTILQDRGITDEDHLHKIEICLDEACSNVVQHAYDSGLGGSWVDRRVMDDDVRSAPTIRLILKLSHDRVTIEVIDSGWGGRRGAHRGVQTLGEYQEMEHPHGLGYYIISKCMDRFDLSYPAESGTRVSMTKFLQRAG